MEEYIKELEAKSVEISIAGTCHRLFFGSNVFAGAADCGLRIDANALFGGHIDPTRSIKETQKVIYLCLLKYREIAVKLGVKTSDKVPTMEQIEVWAELEPEQAEKGMRYVFEQLITRIEMASAQKKNLNESLNESAKHN